MKKEYCPYCAQAIMSHRHNLSKALCEVLLTAACKYGPDQPFHLQRDLNLTKSEYNNWQKLRYWGLVKKTYTSGKRDGGFWQFTGLVHAFLNGRMLPRTKTTFNNEVLEESEDKVSLYNAVGSFEVPERWAERAEPVFLQQGNLF
jgi:hypothetical protein